MKLMHVLPLFIYTSFPKCPPFIFRFSPHSMDLKYAKVRMSIVLSFMLNFVNIIDHFFIEYLISLYKLFAHCYFFEIMNHLTLCSSSNRLLYPCFYYIAKFMLVLSLSYSRTIMS